MNKIIFIVYFFNKKDVLFYKIGGDGIFLHIDTKEAFFNDESKM
jgi:hypothetical protein